MLLVRIDRSSSRLGRRSPWHALIGAGIMLTLVGASLQLVPAHEPEVEEVQAASSRPRLESSTDPSPPGAPGNALPDGVDGPGWGPPTDDGAAAVEVASSGRLTRPPAPPAAPEAPAGVSITGQVQAADQQGDGGTVTVDLVAVTGTEAVVVVRANALDRPGAVLGSAPVPAGESTDVLVTLDAPLEATEVLWIDLHRDAAPVGVFDHPGGDPPLRAFGPSAAVRITYEVQR